MTGMGLQEIGLNDIELSNTEAQAARRKRFKPAELTALAASIRTHGVVQPIIVRKRDDLRGKPYELVAGERRYAAAREAELKLIPAVELAGP